MPSPPSPWKNFGVQSLWDCFWDHFWTKKMFLGGQMTRVFRCINTYPFCPLRHIAMVSAFRSITVLTSHTLRRMRLARLIVCLEEWKLMEDSEEILSHCSQPSLIIIEHVTTCLHAKGVHWAVALYGDAKQPMVEEQKWSGWNQTNLLLWASCKLDLLM